jgi:hypothetical protein
MMGDMHSPENSDFMIKPMQPIIKKILRENQKDPIGDRVGKREELMDKKIIQD